MHTERSEVYYTKFFTRSSLHEAKRSFQHGVSNTKLLDVILPLAIRETYTYALPDSMPMPAVGARVLVPLGKKVITGIVLREHTEPIAEGIALREIIEVLDVTESVVSEQQLQLWQWMADYYMAPLGDILKAALPQGMKKEEGYRPRTETYITLADTYRSRQSLHNAFAMLHRSTKQQDVFRTYLSLSHWDEAVASSTVAVLEVTKEELMNASHCNAAIVKALLDKKMLRLYDVEVGRLNGGGAPHPENINPLPGAQQCAKDEITSAGADITLLHGVTSSGKTEV